METAPDDENLKPDDASAPAESPKETADVGVEAGTREGVNRMLGQGCCGPISLVARIKSSKRRANLDNAIHPICRLDRKKERTQERKTGKEQNIKEKNRQEKNRQEKNKKGRKKRKNDIKKDIKKERNNERTKDINNERNKFRNT